MANPPKSDETTITHTSKVNALTRQSLLWYTTLPFCTHVVRFGNSLLLARLLQPSDFGIAGIVFVIMYYSDVFSDFGFSKALVQKKNLDKSHFHSYFTFNLIISITIFSALQASAKDISEYLLISELEQAIRFFSWIVIITAFSSIAKVKLRRELRFKTLALIEALKVGISIVISLSLATSGFDFWSILIATLASQLLILAPLFVAAGILPVPTTKLNSLKDLINFGKWDFLSGQMQLISDSLDKIIIAKYFGATEVGIYDKALGIPKMPYEQIASKIGNVSFSSFSRLQENLPSLKRSLCKITTLNSILLTPLLMGLYTVSDSFVLSVLGDKWLEMTPVLNIFCIAFLLSSLCSPLVAANIATGNIAAQTKIRFVLFIFLISAIAKFAYLGLSIVAFIFLAHNAILFICSLALTRHYHITSFSDIFRAILPAMICTSLMITGINLNLFLIDNLSIFQELLVSVVTGFIIYFIAIFLYPGTSLLFIKSKLIAPFSN